MIRVITISREYGSGGAAIARLIAERLGWKLVDNLLLTEIAKQAKVNHQLAERYDETVNPWFNRLMKALWAGGYEGVASTVNSADFDADAMVVLCRRVIEEAATIGSCVIVGRGGQCILQENADAFHVSVYAPLEERVQRLRERHPPGTDVAALADETDRKRAHYIRHYFGHDWTNRHLYDLSICSSMGLEAAVAAILCAAHLTEPKKSQ
jgi:cytidylate kinase